MCNLFFKYFIKQKKNILFLIVIIIIGTVISSISKIENNKNKEEQIFSKERAIEIFKKQITHNYLLKQKHKKFNLSIYFLS